ncbi:MAG: UMF1 family MFS transporter [Saprospiraceae bacterium]|jgi:UMF1 family MFS transporter
MKDENILDKLPAGGSPPLNDKRTITAWAFFDWANSAYALTITTAIFPAYFTAVTLDNVNVLGMQMKNTSLYAYAISAAYLVLMILSPWMSGIADYGGKRMTFMRFFTVLGALACIGLTFFEGMSAELPATAEYNLYQLGIGTICFMLGTIGFAGGLVFYNSYLPLIASEDQYDRVSAKGFSYGYIGSVLLLILNLAIIQKPEWFGLENSGSWVYRIAFLMVGVWWLGFALIPFKGLPQDDDSKPKDNLMGKGFEELKKVWQVIKYEKNIKSFLGSFFFYSAGVQTVLFLAAIFAKAELGFDTSSLILVILILQIVAIGGAHLFAKISDWKGNKFSIITMLFIWIIVCIAASMVQESIQFYAVAAAVGLVMGGIQSMSRSTYSKLLPQGTQDTTSYFSFYDILEKLAIVSGTFIFGITDQLVGMRNSVLVLTVFFIMGIILMWNVKIRDTKIAG